MCAPSRENSATEGFCRARQGPEATYAVRSGEARPTKTIDETRSTKSVDQREAGAQQVFVAAGAAHHHLELAGFGHGLAVTADEAQVLGFDLEAHRFRLAALQV